MWAFRFLHASSSVVAALWGTIVNNNIYSSEIHLDVHNDYHDTLKEDLIAWRNVRELVEDESKRRISQYRIS